MNPVTITAIDFTPPFRGSGYVMSYVTQTVLRSRIICLNAGDGRVGYGEFVRYPALDADEVAGLEDVAIGEVADVVLDDLPVLARKLRDRDHRLRGMAFGLETAHLDLMARASNVPLYTLLGGRFNNDIADYLSLSCEAPQAMADRVRTDGLKREVIQIKLDGKAIHTDIDRIDAVMGVLQPTRTILIDFNGALSPQAAKTIIAQYDDPRIMWEEPCKSYEENRDLVDTTGAQLLFDQCLSSLDVITRACGDGAMVAACIKPALLGGLSIARAARDICTGAGVAVRVDGPWCGPVGSAAALHLAVGTPPEFLIAGTDLSEPLILNEDWGGIIRTAKDRIMPVDGPGHGVVPPQLRA